MDYMVSVLSFIKHTNKIQDQPVFQRGCAILVSYQQ